MPRAKAADARPVRCAIYCRLSLSRHGDTTNVDDQEKLCRSVAKTRGWSVSEAHVFKDNSRSAWKRNRKRPRWDAMLAAIKRGEIDAIVVYHGDRLIRQPWDLELLLRLAEEQGIRLASPIGERDLDNPDDQFILRIEVAAQCRESASTSRRMKRHYAKRRAEGEVVRVGGRGGRPFGFEPDGRTIRREEAAEIRRVAKRIKSGEKIGAIARDLTQRGIRTTAGNPFEHGSLKKLMMRPRLAGLVPSQGEYVKAVWLPILERDEWEDVCSILASKAAHFAYATNARTYQLSGIAECGECGARLAIRHNTRGASLLGYGCINPQCKTKVHRSVHHLDAYVDGAMVRLLGDERIRKRLATPVSRELTVELRQVEAHKKAILKRAGDEQSTTMDPDTAADILAVTVGKLNRRIKALREQISATQAPHALDGLWGMSLDGWRGLPLSRRRAAIATAMRIVVKPSGRRGPGFDPTSVDLLETV